MNYRKLNDLTGWVVFALSFVVYALTVAPTASFWDCGEFIAVSNELEVPHPPGAPLYLLLGRILAIFSFGNVEKVALMVNMLSVLATALTSMLTVWIITAFGRKILAPTGEPTGQQAVALALAGFVGGMTVTFCDSIWFNAVEAEVYAASSLFTALVVWLMLKWEARADEPDNLRWILLITYVMGLSVGVHLLNLLTIPALGMIYYFRKYPFSWGGFAASLGISVVILGLFNSVIIKQTFSLAMGFERFFTGTYDLSTGVSSGLGLPFGTGALVFALLVLGGIVGGIIYSIRKRLVILNTVLLGVVFIYLGISSYAMIIIRANADPPINENNPSNILTFLSYMEREQYGDWPILTGTMYNSVPVAYKDGPGKAMYYKFINEQTAENWTSKVDLNKLNKRYVIYDRKRDFEFEPGSRFFPRMHSSAHYDGKGTYSYKNFVKDLGNDPNDPSDDRPTSGENLAFFWAYQVKYMYLRYFAWNFIGRQGDEQSRIDDWESGLLPASDNMPDYAKNDPSRNHYYYLPFLLGILGAVWHYQRNKYDFFVVLALFFFTGLAIILYLNQTPLQPRERDYSYAGSFQTFCIWIGLSVLALCELFQRVKPLAKPAPVLAGGVALLTAPVLMAAENWDDHSRAGNYVAPDSAYNMLMSCEKDAVLFTNGDNDTFPLWYLQEVEGVRTDVRIVNLSLLNTDWYIHQLKMPCNDSPPLPLSVNEDFYMGEMNSSKRVDPNLTITLPVDKQALLANKVIRPQDTNKVVSPMVWKVDVNKQGESGYLMKQDLMILDLIQENARQGWKRPIYFAITIPTKSFIGLNNFFQLEGMAYRVVPIPSSRARGDEVIHRDKMYKTLMEVYRLRGLNDPSVYYNSDIRRMIGNLRHNYIRLATDYVDAVEYSRELRDSRAKDSADYFLTEEQQQDYLSRAQKLVQFAEEKITDETVRTEPYYYSQYARVYIAAGDPARGKQILETSWKRCMEDIRYDIELQGMIYENDMNYYGLQGIFLMAQRELKDRALTASIAADLYDVSFRMLDYTRSRNMARMDRMARTTAYTFKSLFDFYRDELNDRAKAERVAKDWEMLTGDPTLMEQLTGRPRPLRGQPDPRTPAELPAGVQLPNFQP